MKLDTWQLVSSIIDAGGIRENGVYVVRNSAGQLHRDDGPAVVCPNGEQAWYRNGQLHRDDGPAVVPPDGGQEWYRNGRNGKAIPTPPLKPAIKTILL